MYNKITRCCRVLIDAFTKVVNKKVGNLHVPRRFTCTQRLEITNDCDLYMNANKEFHCICLDQKGAFDRADYRLDYRPIIDMMRTRYVQPQTCK